MKYFFLLFSVAMLSVISVQAQKDVKTKNEVIIITKSKEGTVVEKKIIDGSDDMEIDMNVDSVIAEAFGENMSIDVDIDFDEDGNRHSKKRIVITTTENGETKTKVWEGDIDEEMPQGFEVELDENRVDVEPMPETKVALGVEINEHAKIMGVFSDSAAEKAGLQKGDIIKKIDQQNIYSLRGLFEHLAIYKPGDKVKVSYEREGKLKKAKLILQAK